MADTGLTLIRRLLIANRGEIAARIARTTRTMGISSVGVYSEPDQNAVHVDTVDMAVALGGASPADSYLRGDAVIEAAVASGCDAVHPGYGFLAERADFAQAVMDAGLVWVGPTPEQISLLGDKMAAKAAAVAAGVPTSAVVEHHDLMAAAEGGRSNSLQFPLLVKAAAGGGGRGMRVVSTVAELSEAVAAASREAESAFGDGTVFAEPFFGGGRHIEVQIFGDHHGTVVHLGERDCSIQRRNQKIIEEAPAPGLDEATRQVLLDGAVALGRHVGYHNAGTVEFLVGADGAVNFLEVNTRLQVEHPVTEAVTGLDLVELQLRVAAGEPLPDDGVTVSGHAIEARLVAESPSQGWLPDTGQLQVFDLAPPGPGPIRVDGGFKTGDDVTPHYDSLLAKVISHGPSRSEAAATLRAHLLQAPIAGVATNRDVLVNILDEDDFCAGRLATSYLDQHPEVASLDPADRTHNPVLVLAATMYLDRVRRRADQRTGFAPTGWRNVPTLGQRIVWAPDPSQQPVGGEPVAVEYWACGDGDADNVAAAARIGPFPEPSEDGTMGDDTRQSFDVRVLGFGPGVTEGARYLPGHIRIEVDGVRHRVRVDHQPLAATGAGAGNDEPVDLVVVSSPSGSLALRTVPRFETPAADGAAGSGPICPLPGTVIAVHVEVGQLVGEGDVLVIVEAMKMEHKITAAIPGTVVALPFGVGDRVDAGDLLVELSTADADADGTD